MEWLTIALSGLLTLLVPAGAILDSVLAGILRSRAREIERLVVRVDNSPSYQILQGKVQRVRLAGRGVYLASDIRIDAVEVETDPLDIDPQKLGRKNSTLTDALRRPASGALRLVLTEEDINRALRSEAIRSRAASSLVRLLPGRGETGARSLELLNLRVDLRDNDRLALDLELKSSGDGQTPETLSLSLEAGLKVIEGRRLQFLEPSGTLNGRRLSSRLLNGFADGLAERLDVSILAGQGIFARLLRFRIDGDKLQVAAFARIDPRSGNPDRP